MSARAKSVSQEIDRDARRLLVRLAGGASLRCAGHPLVLALARDRGAPARELEIPQALTERCLELDWLEQRGDDITLSEVGRAWLRRCAAGDDGFRQQHQLMSTQEREVDGVRRSLLVNEAESPLGWLRRRKDRNGRPLMTDEQYEAGERLRADYWYAHLSPRVTANWSGFAPSSRARRGAPSHSAALTDNAIAAKQRIVRALQAVGPELVGVLVDVCCELKGLEQAEKVNGWPQRAGKVVLQLALTRLARHYGLIVPEHGPRPGRARLRHWGVEDYRPTLDAWQGSGDQ